MTPDPITVLWTSIPAGLQGQLANGFMNDRSVPIHISAVTGGIGPDELSLTALSAGGLSYACGLTSSNAVFCWGRGPNGELGNPGTTITAAPLRVPGTL